MIQTSVRNGSKTNGVLLMLRTALNPSCGMLRAVGLQVDLGLEQDRGRRYALWGPLYMLRSAPDLIATFDEVEDRDAARNFMDLLAASEGEGPGG